MRRAAVAAVGVLLVTALPSYATVVKKSPRGCAMTDPAGDVVVEDTMQPVDARQVDLRSVGISVGSRTLTVTVVNAGGEEYRLGTWRLDFTSGRTPLYVVGSLGAWLSSSDPDGMNGFRGGVVGRSAFSGSGSVSGDGQVRITVPLSAFGAAAPRRGTVLSGFTATAREKFVSSQNPLAPPVSVSLVDTASWPYAVTVGGGCRP
jgi:hypothetical protein